MPTESTDVLLVTATKVEAEAVKVKFDLGTTDQWKNTQVHGNPYVSLGTVNGAKVHLAFTEMSSGSLGSSQQTVMKGIADLNPWAVVLVGVAFGFDDFKQEIGDILVSNRLAFYEHVLNPIWVAYPCRSILSPGPLFRRPRAVPKKVISRRISETPFGQLTLTSGLAQ
jgi:nucleoside phosphorylase